MRRRFLAGPAAVVAAVLLAAGPVGDARAAVETRTVQVSAEVHGFGRTPEEGRREALQRARDKAVAEVAGIHIAAQQLRLKSENPDAARDAFSYLVHTSSYGRIVREEVAYETELVDDVPVYRANLSAEVALEEGARDPGFSLDLQTRPRSGVFREGEPIVLELTTTRDCYVTILNIHSDGQVSLLFPNEYDRANHVEAGSALRLPRPGKGFEIHATRGDGPPAVQEQILAVATLDEVPFDLGQEHGEELVPVAELEPAVTSLNRWLLRIPLDRRAEALWSYEVVE
jgi:hypothetical protein